jgi:hypothetical protein
MINVCATRYSSDTSLLPCGDATAGCKSSVNTPPQAAGHTTPGCSVVNATVINRPNTQLSQLESEECAHSAPAPHTTSTMAWTPLWCSIHQCYCAASNINPGAQAVRESTVCCSLYLPGDTEAPTALGICTCHCSNAIPPWSINGRSALHMRSAPPGCCAGQPYRADQPYPGTYMPWTHLQ